MISRFFIDRPIFASVVSIVITLIGAIALLYLPIAQYPRITPPGVSISISYPGASAKIVADTVAAPIEQQVNGVPGMLYMSSQMGNDGSYSLTVTFDIGVDLNTALVMVQNRVTLAMPQLPTQVQNQGITIRKRTPDILMIVNLISPDERYNDIYLSNYATINLRDELLRVPGVSDITYQGQRDYSIRIWLDPQKLAARNMTALDVATAIRNQNIDAPAGQIGQQPAPQGQVFQLPIDTLGRLTEPEEFANIIIKVGQTLPPAPSTGSPRSVVGTLGVPTPPASASAGGRTTSGSTTSGGGAAAPTSVTRGGGASSTATVGSSSAGSSTSTSGTTTTGTTSFTSTTTLGVSTTGGGSAAGGGTTLGGGAAGGGGTTGGSAGGGSSTASNTNASSANTSSSAAIGSPDSGTIGGISINTTAGAGSSAGASATLSPGQPSLAIVRVRDVGTVELGAQNYNQSCLFDGKPSVGLAVYQLPGTNALEVADRVRAKMDDLKSRFPEGIDYSIAYDTTPFIRESVSDVMKTLLIATILVAVVVLAFLQSWRSVVIPMIAVPVAIVSTFAVMAALGFSLNNIS
ncbi:MAG TPA: efflux RND transporter permease subunit, partial [Pirellulales bacterium]